jgi:hypothetical protein
MPNKQAPCKGLEDLRKGISNMGAPVAAIGRVISNLMQLRYADSAIIP